MTAPDAAGRAAEGPIRRGVMVHLHQRFVEPEQLRGACVVVIDVLRASTTIASALHAGAERIECVLTVEEAKARAVTLRQNEGVAGRAAAEVVLGGERGGLRPEGFDLGNSPSEYEAKRVRGRVVVFSTTNGTAALARAALARRVVVGALVNCSRIIEALAHEEGMVHLLAAGTREEVSLEDVVAAGAIAEGLIERGGREASSDDGVRVAISAWREARARPRGVIEALEESRGGRNLARLGLSADIAACAAVDAVPVLPARGADGALRLA
jgi:2-phosphosulfolactate phosphatase